MMVSTNVWQAWVGTYFVHSTVLLAATALLLRWVRSDVWRDAMWKAAVVGGVLTATVQSAGGFRPLAGSWSLREQAPAHVGAASKEASVDVTEEREAAPEVARVALHGGKTSTAPTTTNATLDPPRVTLPRVSVAGWLMRIWVAGATLLLGMVVIRHVRLYRLIRGRSDVRDGRALQLLRELQFAAGVRRVRLTSCTAYPTPFAIGRTEICVPERFLTELDEEQQRSALAHELGHLVRRDPLWQLTAGIVGAVFFFQPLNHYARRRMREVAEHLADDWAVAQTGSVLGLARCLAQIAEWSVGRPAVPEVTTAMAEKGSRLLLRVQRLLAAPSVPATPRIFVRTAAALGAMLLVAIAAPTVTASRMPVWPGPRVSDSQAPVSLHGEQEQFAVIRHPDPAEPLARRWAWSSTEARRRGHESYWVAYAIERPLRSGSGIVSDSRGFEVDELSTAAMLGSVLYGDTYRRPPEEQGKMVQQPVVFLFHMRNGNVDRISTRSASAPMSFGTAPVYWLGNALVNESYDWLRARYASIGNRSLQREVLEGIALHPDEPRVVPFLTGILRSDTDDELRADAAEGLAWQPTAEAAGVLRETALRDRAVRVSAEAAEALGDIGTPEGIAALIEIARSSEALDVRREAVEAMAEYQQASVLQTLFEIALNDADGSVREEAVEAMGDFPAPQALPFLTRLVREARDHEVRMEAIETIGDLDSAEATRVLEQLLKDRNQHTDVRTEALSALTSDAGSQWAQTLYDIAANDIDRDVVEEAIDALGDMGAPAAPLLRRLVWEATRKEVQREAVETLGDLPANVALPELDRIIAEHSDITLIVDAIDTLGDFAGQEVEARLLKIARSHRLSEARRAALDALRDRIKT